MTLNLHCKTWTEQLKKYRFHADIDISLHVTPARLARFVRRTSLAFLAVRLMSGRNISIAQIPGMTRQSPFHADIDILLYRRGGEGIWV